MIIRSCSWCHEFNEIREVPTFCWRCGHRADVARISCDCRECKHASMLAYIVGVGAVRGV